MKKISYIVVFIFIMMTTGCSKSNKKRDILNSSVNDESVYYGIQEIALPNKDIYYKNNLDENCYVRELSLSYQNNTIYRYVQVWNTNPNENPSDINRTWYYLQKLSSPYNEWEYFEIFKDNWKYRDESGHYYNTFQLLVTQEEKIYSLLGYSGDKYSYSFADFDINATYQQPLKTYEGRLSILWGEFNLKKIVKYTDDATYLYSHKAKVITKLDKDFEIEKEYPLTAFIWGTIYNPKDKNTYYYGINNKKFQIRDIETDSIILSENDEISEEDSSSIHAVCSDNGNIYFTNGQYLWRLQQNGIIEKVSDFMNQGYLVDNVYDMTCIGETVYLYINEYGVDYVMCAAEAERPQYLHEITLATWYPQTIEKIVTKFNLRNEDYHITIIEPKDNELYYDFWRRMQMEISIGKGPDILILWKEDAIGYAKNGYLKDMSTFLDEPEILWKGALEYGQIDGVLYRIPFAGCIVTSASPKSFVGERTSWTIEEMMEMVQNSDMKYAIRREGVTEYIISYGLYDKNNTTYIDWDKGISYLAEEPFIELLEFSKKYVDEDFSCSVDDMEADKVAATNTNAMGISIFSYLVNVSNELTFTGFPSSNGSGIYAYSELFYMNSSSKNDEGVKSFVDYMLSYNMQYRNAISVLDQLPIRMDVMDAFIDELCSRQILKKEEVVLLKSLIEKAEPQNEIGDVSKILEEELPAYINDQKTVEEVAAIIHNRVQLYLNENK